MLLRRQIEAQNDYAKASAEVNRATDEGREGDAREAKIKEARLSDELLDLYNINKTVGTETGRGLNARKMLAYEDYSLAAMETRLRAAREGTPLEESQ